MLGLTTPTTATWVQTAASDLNALLIDHAHCEMKAATNALSLLGRYPGEMDLVTALTALALEELEHFKRVVDILNQRGLALGIPAKDVYAQLLRTASGKLPGRHRERFVLVDRLLIGALIEARSCERFRLLLEILPREAPELVAFYRELFECEAKHFRTYVDLAKVAAREYAGEVESRFETLARMEGEIVADLSPRAAVHG
jgi:tRNA 2-(methylsulfanyl)-N6-isopentenyladenosine37 hydroxylase